LLEYEHGGAEKPARFYANALARTVINLNQNRHCFLKLEEKTENSI
jgi:hypothetical protein